MSSPVLHGHQLGTYDNAELAQPQMGAKVGSYLAVLTESSVRGLLRRKTKSAAEPAANDEGRCVRPASAR
jgi:hypothetical protein